ncbi:hypothetical protein M231_01697 [Tremella mesenterica]|uniref:Rab-GAP TBC domain-containing protein n=1 Tax=Tremella mesenterica TaxID=5217 RepID=A0A4Q1BSV6_TREME|nr:hypothetical protein M231_01697 [Tremella mesenterica]
MTGAPAETIPTASFDDASLLSMSSLSIQNAAPSPTSSKDGYEHLSAPSTASHPATPLNSSQIFSHSSPTDKKARLLYCRSHVSIHPTSHRNDDISGYLAIVQTDSPVSAPLPESTGSLKPPNGAILIVWVPNELLEQMNEQDRESYKRVDENSGKGTSEREEDGFVFISLPPPRGEKYAFSIPLSDVYSILVYPPSLSHWHGSATLNLIGGVSLPTLYFHDDESPLLLSPPSPNSPDGPIPRSQWGFPPFLALLKSNASLLRSRLIASGQSRGAELWLVNPTKSDREVHEHAVEDSVPPRSTSRSSPTTSPPDVQQAPYPPKPFFPNPSVLSQNTPKQTLLTGLSTLTNLSRKTAQQLLSHPLAQPMVPHLPPIVQNFVNASGEWERSGRSSTKAAGGGDVANEFEAARLYLARWARVVAEEGERARRNEVTRHADLAQSVRVGSEDLASSLGVFSLLTSPNSKRPIPHPTRMPHQPITAKEWDLFAAQRRDELWVRREIFRRGLPSASEVGNEHVRREGWEVLLGVVPWSVGGLGGGEAGQPKRRQERHELLEKKRNEYRLLKKRWQEEADARRTDSWKDEWHRIDVDCRRTDRQQAIYAVPASAVVQGEGDTGSGEPRRFWEDGAEETAGDQAGQATLNPHIAALRTILMTYHTYRPELGYVQGMSDLLSPTYVVFGANEADAFWGLVGIMQMLESNFLRDQSGMKHKLSTLQQLIRVMDPELYTHLERTDSLNLFFCFRWILIAFKREFSFDVVIKLWDILWTNYYSNDFVLFVALAILQSHRDVIIRYLTEFDEVLKYANDLSGTIDLVTTLAQAEVLFLAFRGLVEDTDHDNALDELGESTLRRRRLSAGSASSLASRGTPARTIISDDLRQCLVGWKDTGSGLSGEMSPQMVSPGVTSHQATTREGVSENVRGLSISSVPIGYA